MDIFFLFDGRKNLIDDQYGIKYALDTDYRLNATFRISNIGKVMYSIA